MEKKTAYRELVGSEYIPPKTALRIPVQRPFEERPFDGSVSSVNASSSIPPVGLYEG